MLLKAIGLTVALASFVFLFSVTVLNAAELESGKCYEVRSLQHVLDSNGYLPVLKWNGEFGQDHLVFVKNNGEVLVITQRGKEPRACISAIGNKFGYSIENLNSLIMKEPNA